MGRSSKIGRIGKTKKEKDALKLTKDHKIAKPSAAVPSQIKKTKAIMPQIQTMMQVDRPRSHPKAKRNVKYVTEGMVDYVTLLRSRQSAEKLKFKMAPPKS